MILLTSWIYYFLVARLSPKTQLHSVFHCFFSFLFTSLLFWRNSIGIFEIEHRLSNLTDPLAIYCCEHSLGYFLADTLDIYLSQDLKRKVYIIHHILAIIGISTIYLGVKYSVFAIWVLEMGGIVHHLKRMTFETKFYFLTKPLYFIVYTISRIYFTLILTTLLNSQITVTNFICFISSLALVIQNIYWLFQNCFKIRT